MSPCQSQTLAQLIILGDCTPEWLQAAMADNWDDSTQYAGGDPWWPYQGGGRGSQKRDRAADSPMRGEQEATEYYRQRSREVQERIKAEHVKETDNKCSYRLP